MSFKKKFLTLSALTAGTLGALHIFNRFIYHISTIDNILTKNGENYYDWTYGRIFYTKEGSGSPILLVHDLNVCSSSYEWNKIKMIWQRQTLYTLLIYLVADYLKSQT